MDSLKLYNTLSRKLEVFESISPNHVGIYVCGPTVYGPPHLGHVRGPIVFDVLRRYLILQGYKVRFVRNITDVGHLVGDADEGEEVAEGECTTPSEPRGHPGERDRADRGPEGHRRRRESGERVAAGDVRGEQRTERGGRAEGLYKVASSRRHGCLLVVLWCQ